MSKPVCCEHCGTRFQPTEEEERFCCSGCEYVYRVIHDENLDRYYDLRGSVSRPVGTSVFSKSDFSWLKPLVDQAESATDSVARISLTLEGVSCVGCVWLVDRLFTEYEGGVSCRVNVHYGTLDLEWRKGAFDLVGFVERLKAFGYRVCPGQVKTRGESKQVVWRLGLTAAFALNGMLYTLPQYLGMEQDFAFAPHFNWLSAVFATLSLAFGGSYFIGRAVRAAWQGIAHLDLPITLGIVAAYLVSWYGLLTGTEKLVYFDFVSTFVFLMLTGRWLQVVAIERNRNRLADIALEAPEVEVESSAGGRVKTSADQLHKGDSFWLKSGRRVPVHSDLLSVRASVGMDWISGESESRLVESGGEIPSGAEVESPFEVKLAAREGWRDSLMYKLSQKSAESEERDAVAQRWIFRYLLVAFSISIIGGAYWLWAGGLGMGLMVFISVLVVSCPCALGIAWPFADEIALARLRAEGVFVTTHTLWNRLSRVRSVVFDKTGTLTKPSLTLLNPEQFDALDERSLSVLSSLCSHSRHPVARALRERLMARGSYFPSEEASSVQEVVGMGLELTVGAQVWRLGRSVWALRGPNGEKGTAFSVSGEVLVSFQFGDHPLPDSTREVDALRAAGYGLAILSGDRAEKAETVGRSLGFHPQQVHGDLLPEQKAAWLEAHEGMSSLMVGDGANDTLAFQSALCCGAPANEQGIVAERADFHYLGNGIQGIRSLLEMGKRRRRAVQGLMAFALAYNVGAVGVALLGGMTPLLAAVLMPLSSIGSLAIVWLAMRR